MSVTVFPILYFKLLGYVSFAPLSDIQLFKDIMKNWHKTALETIFEGHLNEQPYCVYIDMNLQNNIIRPAALQEERESQYYYPVLHNNNSPAGLLRMLAFRK